MYESFEQLENIFERLLAESAKMLWLPKLNEDNEVQPANIAKYEFSAKVDAGNSGAFTNDVQPLNICWQEYHFISVAGNNYGAFVKDVQLRNMFE